MKRLNAPKGWMLNKLGGVWAPRPSTGPHKLRESIPVIVLLRNRLKYALTRHEVQIIVMNRLVKVDQKVRTDMNFPSGFMDVITLEKTGENFRLMYDSKGRFCLTKVSEKEAGFKLCRVKKLMWGDKNSVGNNSAHSGRAASVPFIVTHDGRTIRYPDPLIRVNDTVKVDLAENKIVDFIKFDLGVRVMITGGHSQGRVGTVVSRERHPGSFDMITVRDDSGHEFATRLSNVFTIGDANSTWVKLPKDNGVRLSIQEDRAARMAKN